MEMDFTHETEMLVRAVPRDRFDREGVTDHQLAFAFDKAVPGKATLFCAILPFNAEPFKILFVLELKVSLDACCLGLGNRLTFISLSRILTRIHSMSSPSPSVDILRLYALLPESNLCTTCYSVLMQTLCYEHWSLDRPPLSSTNDPQHAVSARGEATF